MQNSNVVNSQNEDYNKLSDEKLLELFKKKNDKTALNFLINRYTDTVNSKVSKYYIAGAEKEDIAQEGLIGLYKAVRNFDESKANSFKTFANLCIERQIITAIKSSNRQKHIPLNTYVSLNNPNYENEDGEPETELLDMINSKSVEDPLETVTKNEYYKFLEDSMDKTLSDFEKNVLEQYIQGKSYSEIAKSLDASEKSVDNAIQRIRKKTEKNIKKFI
jgi:RNA polymerase sporulation-specific sigma factor